MHTNFHLVPIPIWLIDLQTQDFLEVNEAALRHYGYSREEFLKMNIIDILSADDQLTPDQSMVIVKDLLNKGITKRFRHVKKSGEIIDVEVNASLYDNHKRVAELVFIHDITALLENERLAQRSEQKLIQSEKRFKALVQGGTDLLAIQSLHGESTFISDNYKSILGYEPEELMAVNSFDYLHEDDREKVVERIQLLNTQKRVKLEPYRFLNKQKEWRWITSTLTNMLDDPAICGIVVNSKDITEAINNSEELLLTNRQYKTVLKAAGEAICSWDFETDEVDYGVTFQEIFGHDIQNRSIMLWHDNIYHKDKEWVIDSITQIMKDPAQDTISLEYRFHKASGDVALVQFKGVFLRNKSGDPLKVIGSFRDITHYKESLYKLNKRNNELSEIAWRQSHEVRSPLTQIMGLIDLLEKEEPKTLVQKELLGHLTRSAAELDEMITTIVKRVEALQKTE